MCVFCSIQDGRTDLSKRIENTILHKANGFFIIPALGYFNSYYLLSVSNQHICSFSHCDIEVITSVTEQIINLQHYLLEHIAPTIVYEHGAENESFFAGNSIIHAHKHIIPIGKEAITKLSTMRDFMKVESSYREFLMSVDPPYIYFRTPSGEIYRHRNADSVESQYMRRIVASLTGKQDLWDWRKYPFINAIVDDLPKLCHCIRGYISSSNVVK